jgi:hypothetical protein
MVGRNFSMPSSSCGGVACSRSKALAPIRIGNSTSPPRPKVKANGGDPQKTSSGVGRRTWRGKQSQIASTSRWKCIVPFPSPVVPEVKAMSATSSAAVSQLMKVVGFPRIRRSSSPSGPKVTDRPPARDVPLAVVAIACAQSAAIRVSVSASVMRALSAVNVSSRARSSGMVQTTTPPALRIANQSAAIRGPL